MHGGSVGARLFSCLLSLCLLRVQIYTDRSLVVVVSRSHFIPP